MSGHSLDASFELPRAALQRVLTVGAARRTYADWHEAVVGYGDRRWPAWAAKRGTAVIENPLPC